MNALTPNNSGLSVLSDADTQKFIDFFYRKTGILFETSKKYFIEKRIERRMEARGCADFRSYFNVVRFEKSGEEMQLLVNEMTVNETYFFRENHQFQALVGPILDELTAIRPRGSVIRIWSIPCSTGEEPYTIALTLLEDWPLISEWDVKLLASDIDTSVLAKAEAGVYSQRSIQNVPKRVLSKYFTTGTSGYEISRDIVGCVERSNVNITEPLQTRRIAPVDVIFCRNVLIYFDDVSRKRAIDGLYERLSPGGFLMLGHSESISRTTSLFRVRKFGDCISYQKPER